MDDNELPPGETERMLYDIERLQEDGVEFTSDTDRAFELAKSLRG
jgi:hypothetical protein